jgi:hypothetical protein
VNASARLRRISNNDITPRAKEDAFKKTPSESLDGAQLTHSQTPNNDNNDKLARERERDYYYYYSHSKE